MWHTYLYATRFVEKKNHNARLQNKIFGKKQLNIRVKNVASQRLVPQDIPMFSRVSLWCCKPRGAGVSSTYRVVEPVAELFAGFSVENSGFLAQCEQAFIVINFIIILWCSVQKGD